MKLKDAFVYNLSSQKQQTRDLNDKGDFTNPSVEAIFQLTF